MKMGWRFVIFTCLTVFSAIVCGSSSFENPYQVLGVGQSASMTEIKRAYKNLAKEWHPDKNKDAEAENKFVQVNQAYQLLADPERRRRFDKTGETEDTPNFNQRHDYSSFHRFDSFFSSGNFKFEFNFEQGSTYRKYSITSKAYENTVVPNSVTKPYLMLFYADWCFPCVQAEPAWRKIAEEFEPIGIGVATVHAQLEQSLTKTVGAGSLPYLVLVLDGRVYHYRQSQLSLVKVVEFVRNSFPYKTVARVTSANVDGFLDGWKDNKVRVVFFARQESIRVRYLLAAFRFRRSAAFGYVQHGIPETEAVFEKFRVNPNVETLLVFNENADSPVASLSMNDIPTSTMNDIINANRYLLLPRLSSQDMFDQLCPPEASNTRKKLCVVLVTDSSYDHEPYRKALRDVLKDGPPFPSRVRFAYIFQDKQSGFVEALNASFNSALRLVALWRRDESRVRYEWLEDGWAVDDGRVNVSEDRLRAVITGLLHPQGTLAHGAVVQSLVDEHALTMFSRLILKMVTMTEYVRENVTKDDVHPILSVLLSIAFIIGVGYFLSHLVGLEEQSITEKYRQLGKEPPGVEKKVQKDVPLIVHELRGETYNGLIRLLRPGCRTILLLVDAECKPKLLPTFQKIVNPYRRNKSLLFAFLMLEKHLEWYRRLLTQTLPEPRELNINPKNCIGTVLSLNGHRRYFCMYHAKYQETLGVGGGNKKLRKGDDGQFLGFGDTSGSSESETSDVEAGLSNSQPDPGPSSSAPSHVESPVLQEHLLDGLANWLDRLFEGSTQRYYIQFWPIMK